MDDATEGVCVECGDELSDSTDSTVCSVECGEAQMARAEAEAMPDPDKKAEEIACRNSPVRNTARPW